MDLLTPGTFVRSPANPDWGLGQVQSAVGDKVTVNFEHRGKLTLRLAAAPLMVVDPGEEDVKIVTKGRYIGDLTWPEIAAAFERDTPVIVPIGAAAKEHGHHLPMKTDWLLAQAFSEGIAARLPVLIAPIVPFGFYPVFRGYPGSQHLSADTFMRVLTELLEGLLDQGAKRIAIVNTGVSTEGPINLATRGILERRGVKIGVADIRRLGRKADQLLTQKFGSHADERETSILLAIAPELVRMHNAVADYGQEPPPGIFLTPTTMQSSNTNAEDYSKTGTFGDPTLASAEKGRVVLGAMIDDLVDGLIALFPDLAR